MRYDANGNMLSMTRIMEEGDSTALAFSYDGNRMSSVSAGDSLWNFSYNPDGTMAENERKRLKMSYNWLGLPASIEVADTAVLKYTYLTDGTKLSVIDGMTGKGLRFRGSFIYTVSPDGTETIESAGHDEGRFYAAENGNHGESASENSDDYFIDTWFVRDYLGSVRAIVDISDGAPASLEQALLANSDYLPFGLEFTPSCLRNKVAQSSIPQPSLSRFRYNSKPEQVSGIASTGLLNYGARMYDPFMVRWTTVDPLAEKYYFSSPYVFNNNNPINFVDWNGMDIWIIDGNGCLELIEEEEDDEFDKLYVAAPYGQQTGQYITIRTKGMLQSLAENSSFTSSSSTNDIFKVFKFAADNTNVEWVVHKNGDSYTLGTMHKPGSSGGWTDYGIEKPDASVHSHPGVNTNQTTEMESMGAWPNAVGDYSDWQNVINDYMDNGRQTRMNYVYFPSSGRLYHVEYYGPRYIRNIKSNYKRFYFGTLNKR